MKIHTHKGPSENSSNMKRVSSPANKCLEEYDNDFIDKQTVQCEFILTTLQNQYMRIQMTHAKNNNAYNSNFDGLSLIKGSQVIIEKID